MFHEVAKAYYSAPPEFFGDDVWVRWDSRLVRLCIEKWDQVAAHARTEPGKFRTDSNHIPEKRVSCIERGANALLKELAIVGNAVKDWSEAMLEARGSLRPQTIRKLLECRSALQRRQQQFDFLEEHPIIRRLHIRTKVPGQQEDIQGYPFPRVPPMTTPVSPEPSTLLSGDWLHITALQHQDKRRDLLLTQALRDCYKRGGRLRSWQSSSTVLTIGRGRSTSDGISQNCRAILTASF